MRLAGLPGVGNNRADRRRSHQRPLSGLASLAQSIAQMVVLTAQPAQSIAQMEILKGEDLVGCGVPDDLNIAAIGALANSISGQA